MTESLRTVITTEKVSASTAQTEGIELWFAAAPAITVREIVSHRIAEQLTVHSNALLNLSEYPGQQKVADDALNNAARLKTFVDVFDDLSKNAKELRKLKLNAKSL